MKKIVILSAMLLAFAGLCFALGDICSVGLGIYKDGSKAFIIDVVPNSPAARANISVGSELVEINGQKAKQLSINEINSLLGGTEGESVNLVIKNPGKEAYTLKRENTADTRGVSDAEFLSYWSKISPESYVTAHSLVNSPRYSETLRLNIRVNNYWVQKREIFKKKYDLCKIAPKSDFEACMNDAVTSIKSQIQNEQTSLFEEERNQKIIRETVREIEMNTNELDFQNNMIKMHLGL